MESESFASAATCQRERAERIHERPLVAQLPQLLGAALRERVLDRHAAAQAHDVVGAVAALQAPPARVFLPVFL
jgi:hypothetical protein